MHVCVCYNITVYSTALTVFRLVPQTSLTAQMTSVGCRG